MAEVAQPSPAAPARRQVSAHTRRVHIEEKIAKGVLWGFAGITVVILTVIVGYILVNGFYQREVSDGPNLDIGRSVIPLTGGGEMEIVRTRGLRLSEVDYPVLQEVVAGEQSFLGYITGQNRRANVVVGGDQAFRRGVAEYFMVDVATLPVATDAAIDQVLNEDEGAIAIVPPAYEAPSGTAPVNVREYSVVANDFVTDLQAGRRLGTLTRDTGAVPGLFTGEIAAWGEIGGPGIEIRAADMATGDQGEYDPLPVEPVLWATGFASPVAPAADVPGRVRADGEGPMVPEAAIVVESTDEFVEAIRSNRGAVGVMRTREAMQNELTIVPVERVRHRRNLRLSTLFEAPSRAGAVGGLSYIIVNTIVMVLFVIAICTPIGVSAAVFLVEYAKQGPLLKTLRVATDTLAGVPSIIFGLFGMVFFSEILRLQTGLLAGSLTLTIMILPTVIRTSEEALKAVPRPLRDGSLALGATKLQTIFRVVVPAASPGILTGMILGIGRAVGETAALLFTMGSNLAMVQSLNSPMRVLSVHLYLLIRENISLANAFAAATILVIIVFLVNFTTTRLIGRLNRMANTA